ncbi:MAG TPA: enoyl-CoA hydratase/isomerase family protein, partial [Chitinophagales bacterium]
MKEYSTLLTDIDNSVLTITINREDKLNAINKNVITDLDGVIDEFIADKTLTGAIITGKGSKAFVAGADISEFKGLSQEQGKTLAKRGHGVFDKIEQSPKPI